MCWFLKLRFHLSDRWQNIQTGHKRKLVYIERVFSGRGTFHKILAVQRLLLFVLKGKRRERGDVMEEIRYQLQFQSWGSLFLSICPSLAPCCPSIPSKSPLFYVFRCSSAGSLTFLRSKAMFTEKTRWDKKTAISPLFWIRKREKNRNRRSAWRENRTLSF